MTFESFSLPPLPSQGPFDTLEFSLPVSNVRFPRV